MLSSSHDPSAPDAADAPTAAEVPVSRAMLAGVRTEILQRIDHARREAKVDAQQLDAKIDSVKAELNAELNSVKAELTAEINGVKADIQRLDTKIDGVKSELKADIQ